MLTPFFITISSHLLSKLIINQHIGLGSSTNIIIFFPFCIIWSSSLTGSPKCGLRLPQIIYIGCVFIGSSESEPTSVHQLYTPHVISCIRWFKIADCFWYSREPSWSFPGGTPAGHICQFCVKVLGKVGIHRENHETTSSVVQEK